MHLHDAKIRAEGRERVVGDLRPCGRDARDERALAPVRKAHQSDVGEQLQAEANGPRFARLTRFGLSGRTVGGGRELRVPAAAVPAASDENRFADLGEIRQLNQPAVGSDLVGHRARRHFEHRVFAVAAGAVRSHAVPSALGVELGVEAEGDQGVLVRTGDQEDRAALAAVAPVGAAAGHTIFATEAHATVTAVTGMNLDVDFVDEHGGLELAAEGNESIGARPGLASRVRPELALRLLGGRERNDADATAHGAVVRELHVPGDLGEQGVVLAPSHVQAWTEALTTLPDENRPAGNEVPVVRLDTKTLRVAVASVSGTALPFFVSHSELWRS